MQIDHTLQCYQTLFYSSFNLSFSFPQGTSCMPTFVYSRTVYTHSRQYSCRVWIVFKMHLSFDTFRVLICASLALLTPPVMSFTLATHRDYKAANMQRYFREWVYNTISLLWSQFNVSGFLEFTFLHYGISRFYCLLSAVYGEQYR